MYECESWTIKKAECWRIDVFELWCWRRLLESLLDSKEIKSVHPKGDQSWIFIGRTDAEAETPKLWSPDATNWLFGKDPDAGKDWRQEEKVMTEDEMVGWYNLLDGHEFEQALGVGDGHGILACFRSMGLQWIRHCWVTELNWSDCFYVGLPGVSMVKNLFAMQEIWAWFLGQDDPLEVGMATHSNILAWEIPWTEQPGGLQSMGLQKSQPQLSD